MHDIFEAYALDTERQELSRDGDLIPLRRKAFQLLTYLLDHRQRVVSKDELFDHLWPQQFLRDASLNTCMREVRLAVGDSGREQRIIRTVRGSGYRVIADVQVRSGNMTPSDARIVSTEAAARLCHMCHHGNPAAALFCNACGARLARRRPSSGCSASCRCKLPVKLTAANLVSRWDNMLLLKMYSECNGIGPIVDVMAALPFRRRVVTALAAAGAPPRRAGGAGVRGIATGPGGREKARGTGLQG